jgi:DNA-binding MarR family transcriptional regulator
MTDGDTEAPQTRSTPHADTRSTPHADTRSTFPAGTRDLVDEAIDAWAKEWPGLDFSPIAVVARLLRSVELVNAVLERTLRPFGLNRSAFDTLTALRRSGAAYELTASDLAERCMRSSSTLTTRIARLEAQGLISRTVHPDDARSTLIRLTPAGNALIEKVGPLYLAKETELLQ